MSPAVFPSRPWYPLVMACVTGTPTSALVPSQVLSLLHTTPSASHPCPLWQACRLPASGWLCAVVLTFSPQGPALSSTASGPSHEHHSPAENCEWLRTAAGIESQVGRWRLPGLTVDPGLCQALGTHVSLPRSLHGWLPSFPPTPPSPSPGSICLGTWDSLSLLPWVVRCHNFIVSPKRKQVAWGGGLCCTHPPPAPARAIVSH